MRAHCVPEFEPAVLTEDGFAVSRFHGVSPDGNLVEPDEAPIRPTRPTAFSSYQLRVVHI
jgi:hypothetical protein